MPVVTMPLVTMPLVTMPLVTMPLKRARLYNTARRLCPPHTPKTVPYHEQSHYCRFMIGHSLGCMDISCFLATFPFT